MHNIKTLLLLSILTALFVVIGYSIGGRSGAFIALIFAFGLNFFSYWYSDKIVLNMSGARESNDEYSKHYSAIKDLAIKAKLPNPKFYIIDSSVPNAFATGRNPKNAAVAASTGLINMLTIDEFKGVMAHELSHIKHYDTLISTVVATFSSAISMIANMLMWSSLFSRGNDREGNSPVAAILIMIIAPITATLIQFAISRQREYSADKRGGEICENPLFLASALEKLENFKHKPIDNNPKASESYSEKEEKEYKVAAHMAIVNHFQKESDSLFSTHPATANRILKLKEQAAKMGIKEFEAKTVIKPKTEAKEDKDNPWL